MAHQNRTFYLVHFVLPTNIRQQTLSLIPHFFNLSMYAYKYKEAKRNCHENIMLLALKNNVQGKEFYHGAQLMILVC